MKSAQYPSSLSLPHISLQWTTLSWVIFSRSSSTPHFSSHTNHTLFETNECYKQLGFDIEDLGCCKVITHRKFGRHVFVATIVTNAAEKSDVMENIIYDMSPDWML